MWGLCALGTGLGPFTIVHVTTLVYVTTLMHVTHTKHLDIQFSPSLWVLM